MNISKMDAFTYFTSADEIDNQALLGIIDKYGLAIIPEFISIEDLNQLQHEFERLLSAPDTNYKKAKPYSKGRHVIVERELIDKSDYPKTAEVFGSPFMEGVKNNYFNTEATLNKDIFVVHDVEGSRHIANDLHFDVVPTFKFFLYLTDTSKANGAFSCVPGSHKRTADIRQQLGNKISYTNRELSRELPYSDDEIVPIEGKAGSLIIFTTEVCHKAGIVSKGERRVMRGHCRELRYEKKKSFLGRLAEKLPWRSSKM